MKPAQYKCRKTLENVFILLCRSQRSLTADPRPIYEGSPQWPCSQKTNWNIAPAWQGITSTTGDYLRWSNAQFHNPCPFNTTAGALSYRFWVKMAYSREEGTTSTSAPKYKSNRAKHMLSPRQPMPTTINQESNTPRGVYTHVKICRAFALIFDLHDQNVPEWLHINPFQTAI